MVRNYSTLDIINIRIFKKAAHLFFKRLINIKNTGLNPFKSIDNTIQGQILSRGTFRKIADLLQFF